MKFSDPFLKQRLIRYDEWLDKGQIRYSSKVIPVGESLENKQKVMPSEQVIEILRKATFLSVQDCECRTHYKRCDHPLEVCLILNDNGEKLVSEGEARKIDFPEAVDILKKANQSGLVHLSLYQPDHEVFALCSCCPCCCHDLQIVSIYGRKDLMARSDYVAETDEDLCIHCGACVERCYFNARTMDGECMVYDPGLCMGCGLCVTSCPVDAVSLIV